MTGAVTVIVPGLLPGASVPPLATVTEPPRVPVPRSVPPVSTMTGETRLPSTAMTAPDWIVVVPV